MLEIGQNPEQVNQRYAMERRIGAEEEALAAASMVVTSTRQRSGFNTSATAISIPKWPR